jgi:excisionase family DNA binding protein
MLLEEVADEARVSLSTVHHWLRTGRLKSTRPGKRRLVAVTARPS